MAFVAAVLCNTLLTVTLKVRHKGHLNEEYALKFQVGEWWNHWIFVTILWLLGEAPLATAGLYLRKQLKAKKPFEVRAIPLDTEVTDSPDSQFLQKVARVVEEHMADDGFGVEELASLIGMSRTTLFRKLKSLTGNSPFELIQNMRLERAHELLTQQKQSVQSAAWAVGMTPRQFSAAYKKRYSHSPSRATTN